MLLGTTGRHQTVARLLLGGFACLLLAAGAVATPLRVELSPRGDVQIPAGFLLTATREGAPAVQASVPPAARSATLDLNIGPWSLTCNAVGVWCPEVTLTEEGPGRLVLLQVFRASALGGEVRVPRGESLPSELVVEGWLPLGGSGASTPLHFVSRATVAKGGGFHLGVPSGTLDLRLAAKGWVPIYRWRVPAASLANLGAMSLRRGGSLSGLVWSAESRLPVPGAKVTISPPPTTASLSRSDARRLQRNAQAGLTNAQGFFQFTSLEPGLYDLRVELPGFSALQQEHVEVAANSETHLPELLLERENSLAVELSPTTTPTGGAWHLELRPMRGTGEPLHKTSDSDGRVIFHDLDSGRYQLDVEGPAGSRLWSGDVECAGKTVQQIELPLAQLSGTVTLDSEPLAAKLEIQTGERDRTSLESSETGEFSGLIRRPRRHWLGIDVSASEIGFSRFIPVTDFKIKGDRIQLSLDLVRRRLEGRVIDQDGRTVEGAEVKVYGKGGVQALDVKTSDHEGQFHFDLEARQYFLRASHPDVGSSEAVSVDLAPSDTEREVELLLSPVEQFHGRVVSAFGEPVAGARIEIETGGHTSSGELVHSDLSGRFAARLPKAAQRAVFHVQSSTHPLWSACLALDSATDVVLTLPDAPGSTLRLETSGDPTLPPSLTGDLVLATNLGGFFSISALLSAGLHTTEETTTATSTLEVAELSGLAPGSYALFHTTAPPWVVAEQACAGAWPSDADWSAASQGGQMTLRFDGRPYQQAHP